MSNLIKYIQTINESEQVGNDGEEYEKLISQALNFLALKRKEKSIHETIRDIKENPKEIEELEKFSKKLNEIVVRGSFLEEDFNEANDIFREINELIDIKKIEDKKIIFTSVKKPKTLIRRKNLLDELLNKDNKYLETLKKIFGKQEYKEFIEIEDEDINNKEKRKTKHRDAYEIAKNIEIEIANNLQLNNYDYKIFDRAYNIGSRNGEISDYWKNLFSSKNKSSKVKTDIILNTISGKRYNLSLKMSDNRFGTPKYIDVYTLILHAINRLLDENKSLFIANLNVNNQENEKKTEDNFSNKKDEKIKEIKEKLKENLKIDEQQTDGYITIINLSLMIDLLLSDKKVTKDTPVLEIQEEFIRASAKQDEIKKIFKIFKELTIMENDIEEIIDKQEDNVLQKIKILIENKEKSTNEILNRIDYDIKLPIVLIPSQNNDTDKTEDEKAQKVVIQKMPRENMEELIKSFINVSDGKYFGNINSISHNIEKLNIFFNSQNKKEKYEKALNLRSVAKKASYILTSLFNDEDEILKEIFSGDFNKIRDFLNTKKNFIKKEIIMEALTGKAKFGKRDKYIATHILTYNKNTYKIKLEEINDAYVNSIFNDVKIKFGFKGGDNKSFNVMHISTSESFLGDIKDKINDTFDALKIKTIKIISSVKKKSLRLLNLFGIKIKINNVIMPKWIVDKL